MMHIELLERIAELTRSALAERRWLAALAEIEHSWNRTDSTVSEAVKARYHHKASAVKDRAEYYEQQLRLAITELNPRAITRTKG